MGITSGNGMGMGMKTRLNLRVGMRMGMNHWQWDGMGLKSHSRSSLLQNIDNTCLNTKFLHYVHISSAVSSR